MMTDHRKTEAFKEALRKGWQKRRTRGLADPWNKGKKGIRTSPRTEFKKGFRHSESTKKKFSEMRGERARAWRGGKTYLQTVLRGRKEYTEWRKAVFARDNYTCQDCGARGVELNADHIKPFATHPELRLELSNGKTLCVPCHRKTSTFAGRGQKRPKG